MLSNSIFAFMLLSKTQRVLLFTSLLLGTPTHLHATGSVDFWGAHKLASETGSTPQPGGSTVKAHTQTPSTDNTSMLSESAKRVLHLLQEHYPVALVEKTTLIQTTAYSETLILVGSPNARLIALPEISPPLPTYFLKGAPSWQSALWKTLAAVYSGAALSGILNSFIATHTSTSMNPTPIKYFHALLLAPLLLPVGYWTSDSLLRRNYDLEGNKHYPWNMLFPMGRYRNRTAADQVALAIHEQLADRGYCGEKIIVVQQPYLTRILSQLIRKHGYILITE